MVLFPAFYEIFQKPIMRGFVQNRMLCSVGVAVMDSEPAGRASASRGVPRAAAARDGKPGCRRFQTFSIIGVTDNFGFGPQPIGKTLAPWTAFFLPDRKGSLPNNGLLSPIPGHHALEHTNRGLSPAPHPHSDV
jgi:hypothetical protein